MINELYLPIPIRRIAYNKGKYFTINEIEAIGSLYPFMSNNEIGKQFGRSASSIKNLSNKYGWIKNNEYLKSKPGCFKKGGKGWNKGIKKYMGANKTSFHTGHVPSNFKKEGTISLRYHLGAGISYKYIKANKKWILLHRYNWVQKYGKIPIGMVIAFKDKNTDNCDVENLMLISRQENLKRNLNREKAIEKMKLLWRKEKLRFNYGLKPITGFGKLLNNNAK